MLGFQTCAAVKHPQELEMRISLLMTQVKDTQVSGTDARSPALAPLICKMSVKYLVYRALLGGSPSWC